jgi:hypothetical protein
MAAQNRSKKNSRQWRKMDLHLHTPASSDYQEKDISYLDILKKAEAAGLDMIAFTDHNTVAGYRTMRDEIQQLEMLEELKRLHKDESKTLTEYRRLLKKIMVLPGFEFTATFGFHILAIFPPEKPVREIEHLLLTLNIPAQKLDEGSATVGATSDVLIAYKAINDAGGMAIAAHANSSNGVAMRGFSFGGQTKIAYTQDSNLYALEVTDLEKHGRRTTKSFFSVSKPEYPRKMHCIQGSDAHRLNGKGKSLGVGDRATEVLLKQVSFEALKDLFESNDFARTRPLRTHTEPAFDFVRAAQEEGPSIVQDFHDSMTQRGGNLYAIIADVCALANTNGGTLYIGITSEAKSPVIGIAKPSQAISQLEDELSNRINPPLRFNIDSHDVASKKILRIIIPRGDDPPYAVDDNKIYVRSETETGLAVRDEIVQLVTGGIKPKATPVASSASQASPAAAPARDEVPSGTTDQPKTGVEVISMEERKGTNYYILRDLRNNNVVKNVTKKSARKLWHYAILSYDKIDKNPNAAGIKWFDNLGLVNHQKQGKLDRYDLAQKQKNGSLRLFFGVTEDGIYGEWKKVVGKEDEDNE